MARRSIEMSSRMTTASLLALAFTLGCAVSHPVPDGGHDANRSDGGYPTCTCEPDG